MYFWPEALRNANAAVVNKLLEIRNPRLWEEGHACSWDGKRFPSWSQNLMSEWRSRYHGDGVLGYWHVETGAICIYSQLRSCSSSEVAAMIEGLFRHDSARRGAQETDSGGHRQRTACAMLMSGPESSESAPTDRRSIVDVRLPARTSGVIRRLRFVLDVTNLKAQVPATKPRAQQVSTSE
jgi:hypothetical protein